MNSESLQIAEFLATKGATKCPTVYLNKTIGGTTKQDRRLLKSHQEKQNALADARFKRVFYQKMIFFFVGAALIPMIQNIYRWMN